VILIAQHVVRNKIANPYRSGEPLTEADHFFHYEHEEGTDSRYPGEVRNWSIDIFNPRKLVLVKKQIRFSEGRNHISSFLNVTCPSSGLDPSSIADMFQRLLDGKIFTERGSSYMDISPEEGERWGHSVQIPCQVTGKVHSVTFQVFSEYPKPWFEEGPRLLQQLLAWCWRGSGKT
jgi:hypothetical protein